VRVRRFPALQAKSSLDLLRSLLVFRCCKIQPLVQNADSILAWSKRVFGTTLTKAVIKATFYKQFVAGEGWLHPWSCCRGTVAGTIGWHLQSLLAPDRTHACSPLLWLLIHCRRGCAAHSADAT
jgi:hypothetical protein